MVFEWESFFQCANCGRTDRADAIEYDGLGYPVCPECGWTEGPLPETGTERVAAVSPAPPGRGG